MEKRKVVIRLLISVLLIFMMVIINIYYKKFENAKYAYNRNCYYRLNRLQINVDSMIRELEKINSLSEVSKESILRLKYLQSSIGSEISYLNLEVNDYEWKIGKVQGFDYGSGFYGGIIDTYLNYIEKNYVSENNLDLKKEREALNYMNLYYKGMKSVIYNGSENANFEEEFKYDITIKGSWIDMVAELNKYDEAFSEEYRDKILVNVN